MRKWIWLAITAVCLCAQTVPARAAEKEPSVEALGAVLVDFDTGRVLWAKNAHTPLAMASTTKIMTCILALENGAFSDRVTVSKRAAAAPDVQMHLQAGETVSLEVLLHALMLQSSNDAAIAVAEHIGGTVEDFCRMMTARAHELGAVNTLFETPNGLDAGEHHSTAYDLAAITRYALQNETFVRLVNTRQFTGTSSRTTYAMTNKNRLLAELDGANGVKTGFTGKAGHCFVGAAERDGLRLISVVLGSGWGPHGKEQKWIDTKRVLEYGFRTFAHTPLIEEGSAAGAVVVERAKRNTVGVHYGAGLSAPLSVVERETVTVRVKLPEALRAPVMQGDAVGAAEVFINGALYETVAICADESVARHDLKTSLEKVLGAFLGLAADEDVRVVLPEF